MPVANRALVAWLVVAGLAVAAVACDGGRGDAATATSIPPERTQVVVLETATPEAAPPDVTSDTPPVTTASAAGRQVEMGVGTYCWTTLCVDKIGPITRGTLAIAPGDEVTVAVPPGTPPLNSVDVTAFPAVNPQQLDGGETAWQPGFEDSEALQHVVDGAAVVIQVALEPGDYVLNVGLFFEGRDVQYAVVLEVR